MLLTLALLLVSLAFLVKASEVVVDSSVRIARLLGISELVIGLTIIAVGTSLPEIISGILAAIHGNGDLVIGNIIGSNMSDVTIVLGASIIFAPVIVDKKIVKRDILIMLFSMLAMTAVISNLYVSWIEGIALLLLFIAYVDFLFLDLKSHKKEYGLAEFFDHFIKARYLQRIAEHSAIFIMGKNRIVLDKAILKEFFVFSFSLIVVIFSANFLVESAIEIANAMHISSAFIGVILAIGTTMPELSVSISAARLNKSNILLGNVVGSCITNSLLVLGAASIAQELFVSQIALKNTVAAIIFLAIFSLLVTYRKSLGRIHGAMLVCLYILFLVQFWV